VELQLVLPDRACWVGMRSQPLVDASGAKIGRRSTIWDISAQKQLECNLALSNRMDPLTGIPNRKACLERIAQALESAKLSGSQDYALIYLDINRLKVINDSMGPSCGDELIRQFVGRTQGTLSGVEHAFGRLGGDEFVVVLGRSTARETIRYVKELQELFKAPFLLCSKEIVITVSIGIVLGPVQSDAPEDMLRSANIAMRRAKAQKQHHFKVFNSRLLEEAVRETEIERSMPIAFRNGDFRMYYQPILDLEGKHINGVEALLRWEHPKYGLLSPNEFLPVAERNDFIVSLGAWALTQSCRDMSEWQKKHEYMRGVTVSVNLSARQLARHDIAEVVQQALAETGLPPQSLKLEITETVAMSDPKLTLQRLQEIKNMGVQISLDDFGTGYSSMSYLQSFPIDTVKVDKCFVGTMNSNSGKRKIVNSVINLAHNLNMNVVAEGVEEYEHMSMLKAMDCDSGQGFLFSRAVTAEEITRMAMMGEEEWSTEGGWGSRT